MSKPSKMEAIGQIASRLEMLAAVVRAAPPSATMRDAFAALRLEEIVGSARLAGARLDVTDVRALLDRGRALGGHRFDDYLVVRAYADAAGWAAQHASSRGPVTTDDLRALHRLALRGITRRGGRLADAHGTAARGRNRAAAALDGPVRDGDLRRPARAGRRRPGAARARPRRGAARPPPAVRARQRPRRTAGRQPARLPARAPPVVLDARGRRAYGAALRAAMAGDATPLARVIGNALARGLERLRDVVEPVDELHPLATFATNGRTDRLYKAAQRGRLRVVRRDGRLYTTAPWVAAYAVQPSTESA